MDIRCLREISYQKIFETFTKAFADYVIPLDFNEEVTVLRWQQAGMDLNHSYGAFDGKDLVAFVLHCPIGTKLYNFGTGVIPSHRGLHLIERIYSEISFSSFDELTLEVVKENDKALKLYQRLGFSIQRELLSLRGTLLTEKKILGATYKVRSLPTSDVELDQLSLMEPNLESFRGTLRLIPLAHELHELRRNGELLAFATFTPSTLSLRELGATAPYEAHLETLLHEMKLNGEALRMMNIDHRSDTVLDYFQKKGFRPFVTQYEMRKRL